MYKRCSFIIILSIQWKIDCTLHSAWLQPALRAWFHHSISVYLFIFKMGESMWNRLDLAFWNKTVLFAATRQNRGKVAQWKKAVPVCDRGCWCLQWEQHESLEKATAAMAAIATGWLHWQEVTGGIWRRKTTEEFRKMYKTMIILQEIGNFPH